MGDSEIELPKTTAAILLLVFGGVFSCSAYLSYRILYQLDWMTWYGILCSFAIFICGLLLLLVGWIWLRVLRE